MEIQEHITIRAEKNPVYTMSLVLSFEDLSKGFRVELSGMAVSFHF